ncbi:MAG: hypothetical protein HXY43_16810 [Fischerella sp.]|uniref:hypothetical protein n=1 Tax=Fischerella sp. TaxID=1191 RepID=UPI0017E2B59A|nr:hypothetical protein [Fischerella sp.]NWF60867.1 hypothetical protein [Fischerella sp.]
MRKTTLLTLSLTCLIMLPATAELGKVWTDFQSYAGDLQDYLKNNLTDTLQPLEADTQTAIDNSTGDLNIPNPNAAGESIRDSMTWYYVTDKFDHNSTVRANLVSNEINRLITRGAVAGVMGANGQSTLREKLKATEDSLDRIESSKSFVEEILENLKSTITDLANPASRLGLNQADLQAQNINIQQEQAKMIGETLGQTVQTNQFLQYTNLNLANISQQVEETNRARRVDTSAEAARLLRNTSQIDLFGRQFEE